jgi:hypothetical protein
MRRAKLEEAITKQIELMNNPGLITYFRGGLAGTDIWGAAIDDTRKEVEKRQSRKKVR